MTDTPGDQPVSDGPADATDEPPFDVATRRVGEATLVQVSGELDVFTSPRLREVLFDPVLCGGPHIVVDLEGVSFIDSTGIGTLVAARRWLTSRDADVSLVCSAGPALRLLEMVRLDKVFAVRPTVAAAIEAANGAA